MESKEDLVDIDRELYVRGMELIESGRDGEALTLFQKSWEAKPHATTAYRIGMILNKQAEQSNAIGWLERAHQLNPDHSQIATAYANALRDQGETERAIQILDSVLNKTPTYGPARDALAKIRD